MIPIWHRKMYSVTSLFRLDLFGREQCGINWTMLKTFRHRISTSAAASAEWQNATNEEVNTIEVQFRNVNKEGMQLFEPNEVMWSIFAIVRID